jgi:hypothetical protein
MRSVAGAECRTRLRTSRKAPRRISDISILDRGATHAVGVRVVAVRTDEIVSTSTGKSRGITTFRQELGSSTSRKILVTLGSEVSSLTLRW